MPSMGGSATLISAPHLGDLLDVDMSAKVDQSLPSWQAGAGKYEPLPGVVGNGATPGGLTVPGTVNIGTPSATLPVKNTVAGQVTITSAQGDFLDGDPPLTVIQHGALTGDGLDTQTLYIVSQFSRAGFAATGPVLQIFAIDAAAGAIDAAQAMVIVGAQGHQSLTINANGGVGLFGATPPTARPAITGALSTVADAPAKAVLTSIIAALVGCGLASSGTT